jgi:hypothetical protein
VADRSPTTETSDTTCNASSRPAILALRPRDAAKALGIGQRKLWELSQPRGPIPCAKIGTCTLYPVDVLRAWLAAEAAKGGTTT